ncbi:MAG: hypothetical protein D8M57_16855 [Candidatus Scalindua sp. AMX11]|nr:MAG: hypothetical protein DWQ00_12590 [Candidatus Scalindua sp.]NOG85153.1 hypothetical protein [Planctomycetota bacterium]RZV67643.1 MAG: hypothetical protein EX341_16835 [Candidatus Scalindua sp. SCAELEC01]TDE63696.1 MAG: hypothetical protein D8M57_16855 [Candidatus Scalindua sp. AMX11]GJQ57225.1 MAG: hypothetical protein SCALA701_00260 [Candidatus Scalindua sp.]
MKRLFSLIVFIAIVLASLQFWSKQAISFQKEAPEVVIGKYLDAVISSDYQTAKTLVSDQNEDIREWLEFLHFVTRVAPEKLISTIHLAHSLTQHQIMQTDSPGDGTVTIHVESTVPDMEKILEITHSVDEIKSLYENGILPVKQKQGTFILGRENNLWKIKEMEGTSGDSASKIAMDLAEKLLSREEGLKLENEIREYQSKKRSEV